MGEQIINCACNLFISEATSLDHFVPSSVRTTVRPTVCPSVHLTIYKLNAYGMDAKASNKTDLLIPRICKNVHFIHFISCIIVLRTEKCLVVGLICLIHIHWFGGVKMSKFAYMCVNIRTLT